MNRPWGSTPINWGQIDYSQDRRGEIMGGAIARTGSMLGNAILEYSKEREEKEKKKKQEEEAIEWMTKQGMPRDEASNIIKGIGIDNYHKLRDADQQTELLKQRAAELEERRKQAEAERNLAMLKAKEEERKNAIMSHVLQNGGVPGTPDPYIARNGTPAADMSAAGYARRANQMGLPAGESLKLGDQIASAMPKPEPKPIVITDPVTGKKRTIVNGQVLSADKPTEELKLEDVKIDGLAPGVVIKRDQNGNFYKVANGEFSKVGSDGFDMRKGLFDFLAGHVTPTTGGGNAGQPPRVTGPEDPAYKNLKPGQQYIGPDGRIATKG
jgi:hypothetical protein